MGDKSKDEDYVTTKTSLEEFKTSKQQYQLVLSALETETDQGLKMRL
jgi:hypothetical protein